MRYRLLFIAVVFTAVLAACDNDETSQSTHIQPAETVAIQLEAAITLVQTETYTGAIFPEAATAQNLKMFNASADGAWTPSEADIADLESGLTAFLQESSDDINDTSRILSRLPDYERQYFGLVQGDDKLIQANFFCDGEDFDWRETAVLVEDGGDCYFQVIYNTDDETYLSLRINGES